MASIFFMLPFAAHVHLDHKRASTREFLTDDAAGFDQKIKGCGENQAHPSAFPCQRGTAQLGGRFRSPHEWISDKLILRDSASRRKVENFYIGNRKELYGSRIVS